MEENDSEEENEGDNEGDDDGNINDSKTQSLNSTQLTQLNMHNYFSPVEKSGNNSNKSQERGKSTSQTAAQSRMAQEEDQQDEDQQDEDLQEEDPQESPSRIEQEQVLHAVGLQPARRNLQPAMRKSRMSQGGGSRLSLPSLSTSRTELLPDMLDNYRTKEPQARNTKRKTRQTKSQEPPIQRKPRKKKAAISPPLIGGLSDADSENLDNPPTPPKNKKRNRAPVVSDAESECSLPSPPQTRKKTTAPPKPRKTMTKKYAASQPILHVTQEEEYQSSDFTVFGEGSPNPDQCQDLNYTLSVLAGEH